MRGGRGPGEALFEQREEQEGRPDREGAWRTQERGLRCESRGGQETFLRFQGRPPESPGKPRLPREQPPEGGHEGR